MKKSKDYRIIYLTNNEMTVKVKHKIWDTVVHKVSKKAFLVIWYKYTESLWVEYIITWDDEKNCICDMIWTRMRKHN